MISGTIHGSARNLSGSKPWTAQPSSTGVTKK